MALAVVGGGRKSGKSRYALALASAHGPRLGFIGTLAPESGIDSAAKIESARAARGPGFVTFEEPVDIVGIVEEKATLFDAIVIDDLTVWVSNLVMSGARDPEAETAKLLDLARNSQAELIVVTSDVDFGFPTDSDESRRMRRTAGLINRRLADAAGRLYWMVFGIPKRVR